MASELTKNWNQALAYLKIEIAEIRYETWIAPLKPQSWNEETSVFSLLLPNGIPDNFVEQFRPNIESSLEKVYGKPVSAAFLYPEDLPRAKKTTPQTDNALSDEFYLNPRYIFSSFVVGKNNNFAWAMAQAVASMPGRSYNPLFIYGGSGLGKTHLMQAIGHYVQKNSKKKVLYVSSEMFTNEYIKAINLNRNTGKRTGVDEFRNKYRKVDVLLLDDVQFFAGKKETMEEFFHTFEALYNENKQIILTADKSPKDIDGLEERLISRFNWGMIADIQPPEYETRVAILQKKAEQDDIAMSEEMNEAIYLIAERVNSNIRELEGAMNRVIAYSNIIGRPISKHLVHEALRDLFSGEEVTVTPNIIKKVVANHYTIKVSDLDSESHARNVSYPRQIAMYLCKEMTPLSYPKIGDAFGGRHHTTIMHAYKTIKKDMKENESLRNLIESFKKTLTEQ